MPMRMCSKCFENNWRFEKNEEFIYATCNSCGHEVSFLSRAVRPKITQEGQPCRRCGTPVIKVERTKPPNPKTSYYYLYWMRCPKCKEMYMVEEAKRNHSYQQTCI